MRVLVTGVAGQLGSDVADQLIKRGYEVVGCDVKEYNELTHKPDCKYLCFDLADEEEVCVVFSSLVFDAVIHCAAWTNVDGAELEENKKLVKKINVDATDNLVKACKGSDIKFVYLSTDYVFDGTGDKPWEPDDKNYSPLNYYGETKLMGELSVSTQLERFFIVRIAWVFGVNGKNFIKAMLTAGKMHDSVRVVDDQIGTPTYTYDLARLLIDMIETDKYGYYHATNEGGYISWCDFAREIFKESKMNVKVIPVSTKEYGSSVAKRPLNSRLDKAKLIKNGFSPLPDWKDALRRYLLELKK